MDKYEKILPNGVQIILEEQNNEIITYAIIQNFIDKGAKCNAYEVKYCSKNSDGTLKEDNAILKEFYPYSIIDKYCDGNNQIIERKFKNDNYYGLTLSGNNDRWLKSTLNSFEKFGKNTNEIKFSNHKLNDYIVDIKNQVLISGNEKNDNTFSGFYITSTDYCNSYKKFFCHNKINCEELVENLRFLLILIRAIGVFHKEEYIVPDLKPSNIIYQSNNTTKLRLIDMDSIYRISDVLNKKDFIPCTVGYAAPELLKQEISKIGKQTDIYSLGIILFEIVFGSNWYDYYNSQINYGSDFRCPIDSYDDEYMFLYNFDEIFQSFDLTIGTKNKLKKIWKKSLCEDVENRYLSTDDMENDIQILIDIIQNKGVHPEVMLNKAINMAKEMDVKDIDEDLFARIKEVDDES